MVTREALPHDTATPIVSLRNTREGLLTGNTESEMNDDQVWGDSGTNLNAQHGLNSHPDGSNSLDVPETLRPGGAGRGPALGATEENPWDDMGNENQKVTVQKVPAILRPGGRTETNPFKRKPLQQSPPSLAAPGIPPAPIESPPPPPTGAFNKLRLGESETGSNPWKPAMEEPRGSLIPQAPSMAVDESDKNVWDSAPFRLPSTSLASNTPAVVSLPSRAQSPAWDDHEPPRPSLLDLPQKSPEEQEFSQDAHAWDNIDSRNKGKAHVQPGTGEDWNLIDHESPPVPLSRQSTWENFADADGGDEPKEKAKDTAVEQPSGSANEPPALPRRRSIEVASPQPPRLMDAADKVETYQIKKINWTDATATNNPRKSPILVQNANGPCPLLALVNALILSTPETQTDPGIAEHLRTREQISLDLLPQVLIEELTLPRHSGLAIPDPPVLYGFLKGLQTGMNVNPRFIPSPDLVAAHKRTSLAHVHPSERGDLIPGTFEQTPAIKLYSSFAVPLIHGWLPATDEAAYDAFSRQASSYDDVQVLLYREEELEGKLDIGLSEQEQQLYEDIITIKAFLEKFPTQLTPWGLEVITKATQPGTFSILFRNDHFTLLYRHPQTLELLALVTDEGYMTHDEVVWESLVDLNGEETEYFSGDFRAIGGPQQQSKETPGAWHNEAESSGANNQGERQTVQGRRAGNSSPPMSPNHEQEDMDLALALQLQDEEDQRTRAEQEQRRREAELSEQYIEQQGRGTTARTGPRGRGSSNSASTTSSRGAHGNALAPARSSSGQINIPVRGASSNTRGVRPAQQIRSLIPPPATTTHRPANAEEDDAPPSYEQASKSTPYVPPAGHPSHPGSTHVATSAARRRISGLNGASGTPGPSTPARQGRLVAQQTSAGSQGGGSSQKDDKCTIM